MDLSQLRTWVCTHSAIRRIQRLQPAGGHGDLIFPPTYPGEGNAPRSHAFQVRRVEGQDVDCVLIDSVQSQANRLEMALLESLWAGAIRLPNVEVDFAPAGLTDVGRHGRLSVLEAPHRIYDAAFRDSELDGVPFMATPIGLALARARPSDAAIVLRIAPTALLFGAWHSQAFAKAGNGSGARFQRCLVSEITGINVPVEDRVDPRSGALIERRSGARRTSSRIDPLGITREAIVYRGDDGWSDREEEAGPEAKQVRPSEINHGSILPTVEAVGVTMDYAVQTMVLSLAALRRLGFDPDHPKTLAGRTYLAALGLVACVELDLAGYALRSRCDLVPESAAPYELIAVDGTATPLSLGVKEARELYAEALEGVRSAGFEMQLEPIRLTPQRQLVAAMEMCRQHALVGARDDAAGMQPGES